MSNVEIPKITLPEILPTWKKQSIDYMEILKKLGLQESELNQDIVERLKNHLSLYKNGVEANITLLEERVGKSREEKVQFLEGWMKTEKERIQKEETPVISPAEVKQEVTALVQKPEELLEGKIKESDFAKSLSQIPVIGEWVVNSLSSFLKSNAKEIAAGSGGIMAFFAGFIAKSLGVEGLFKEIGKKSPEAPTEIPPVQAENTGKQEDKVPEKPTDTVSENTEQKKQRVYKAGIKSLLSLSGVRIEWNESTLESTVLDALQKKSISEIWEMQSIPAKKEYFLRELPQTGVDYSSMLGQILEALSTESSKDLIRISLQTEQLLGVLMPKGKVNENIALLFWESKESGEKRLKEIYEGLKNKTLDYKNLSLYEISILYLASFPGLGLASIPHIWILWDQLREMTGHSEDIGTMIWIGKVSEWLLKKFAIDSTFDFFWNTVVTNDSLLKEKLGTLTESEEISLKNLIEFKNFLLSPAFIDMPQLGMSPEHKAAFLSNLNYQSIIALYEIFAGSPRTSWVNALTLPSIVLTLSYVIGKKWENPNQNAFLAASYLWGYGKDIAMGTAERLQLSEDQKILMGIYSQKMIDVILLAYTTEFQAKLGAVEGITGFELGELALASFGTGVGLNLIGNKMIKKGIEKGQLSFLGKWFKKLWWIGILFGIVAGGAELLQMNIKTWNLSKDLKDAVDTNDIKKAIEVLKTHKDSTHEYVINGEKLVVVAYPGDTPLVFFRGRVWNFTIVDESGSPKWSLDYIEGLLKDSLSEKTDIIQWANGSGEVRDVKIENGSIVFWNNIETKNIADIFVVSRNMEEKQIKNWAASIEDWLNVGTEEGDRKRQILGADYIEFLKGNRANYIPLTPIGEKSFIVMQAIWEYSESNS